MLFRVLPGLHHVVSRLAKRVGLYRPLRWMYVTLFYSRSKKELTLNGVTCSFHTPTPSIAEDVSTFIGEEEVLRDLFSQLDSEDVLWDVGASLGLYSVFSSAKVNHVYAFEPERWTRNQLARNIALNQCRNVTVLPVALGRSDGTTQLFTALSPNVGTHALARRMDYRVRRQGKEIPVHRGDTLVEDGSLGIPSILKIDVEGAELQVLSGLQITLQRSTLRLILVEYHPVLWPLFDVHDGDIDGILIGSGFRLQKMFPRGSELLMLWTR
jgi:FkbM family methyltransferase